jgi:DNA invertase Pin-like site-specific DNA recombinase
MTFFAYLRVSTDAQDVENQRHGIDIYAKKLDFEPLEYVADTASGRKDWRKRSIGEIIARASAGDVLIVSEISRLARSTIQVLEILQDCTKAGLSVHIVKSNMIMDGSLNSRITATILGLAAEIEREFISARTTEALARRKALGLPVGRPRGVANRTHKLDKHFTEIKAALADGESKASLSKRLNCEPQTLYNWMYNNGFQRFIKSKRAGGVAAKKKKPAEGGS